MPACTTLRTFVCFTLALAVAAPAFAQRERTPRPDRVRDQEITTRAAELIEAAFTAPRDEHDEPTEGSYQALRDEARTLLARAVTYCDPKREHEALIEAAYAYRLITMLERVPDDTLASVMPVLLEHPEVGKELAFLAVRGTDRPAGVLHVLDGLVRAHGSGAVGRAPDLVAALCVVHDDRRLIRVNENAVEPESPETIFAYFARADLNRTVTGLTPELLVWVVNTTDARELVWANERFAGRPNVGTLYHTIQYDTDHFRMGRPKRVTEAGFSLPNIARHGGVCADQAFFTEQVGRSIGVPAAYIRGRSSELGHAWVGYLRVRGKSAWWDFSEGRYEDYKRVRGSATDPQSHATIPDSEVALSAAMFGMKDRPRHTAVALVEAERVLASLDAGAEIAPFVEGSPVRTGRDIEARLELLERAITLNTGERRAWRRIQQLATDSELTHAQKVRWAEAAFRLAGTGGIEFVVDFTMPLIESIEDPGQRSDAYGALYRAAYKDRPGVAAEVLLANAALFGAIGDKDRQLDSLRFLAVEFADESNHAYTALHSACHMLVSVDRADLALDLVRRARNRMTEPDFASEFASSSNWVQSAQLNVALLQLDGQTREASNLLERLRSRDEGNPEMGARLQARVMSLSRSLASQRGR